MYKFTNGVVVFTIEDRDRFIKAGYTLVEEENHEEKNNDEPIAKELETSETENKRIPRRFK